MSLCTHDDFTSSLRDGMRTAEGGPLFIVLSLNENPSDVKSGADRKSLANVEQLQSPGNPVFVGNCIIYNYTVKSA